MSRPYETCGICPVHYRCKRINGESPLPEDYYINPECSGYVMLSRALELSKIPKEYKKANRNAYDFGEHMDKRITSLLDKIETAVDGGYNILLTHLNKGTGKTFTACTLMNEFIYNGCMNPKWFDYISPMALYIKFGSWANSHRDKYSLNDESKFAEAQTQMDYMKETPLLVIDDVGSGRITPIIRDLFYDVVDYRKEQVKSTIFTTNIPEEILAKEEYLGEIIVSRLMYRTTIIKMGGEDRRKRERY